LSSSFTFSNIDYADVVSPSNRANIALETSRLSSSFTSSSFTFSDIDYADAAPPRVKN